MNIWVDYRILAFLSTVLAVIVWPFALMLRDTEVIFAALLFSSPAVYWTIGKMANFISSEMKRFNQWTPPNL
jgi:hypothetical protein